MGRGEVNMKEYAHVPHRFMVLTSNFPSSTSFISISYLFGFLEANSSILLYLNLIMAKSYFGLRTHNLLIFSGFE